MAEKYQGPRKYDETMSQESDAAPGESRMPSSWRSEGTVGRPNDLQQQPNAIDGGDRYRDVAIEAIITSKSYQPNRYGWKLDGKTGKAYFSDVRIGNDTVRMWGAGLRVKNGNGVFLAPSDAHQRGPYTLGGGATTLGSAVLSVTTTDGTDSFNFDQVFAGHTITGAGIPPDSYVVSVDPDKVHFTINNEATATAVGLTFTFTPPPFYNEDYMRAFVDSQAYVDTNCTTVSGSALITVTTSAPTTASVQVGTAVTGPGIQQGSFIKEVTDPTHFTLNKAATASASGVSLIFTPDIGVLSLPASDRLWFTAAGKMPKDGNLLMSLSGPHSIGTGSTGLLELRSVLQLAYGTNSSTSIEGSGFFNQEGNIYWNTVSKTVRYYDGTSWGDLGGGGSVTSNSLVSTHSNSSVGQFYYAHGLGVAPSSFILNTTFFNGGVVTFSNGGYDGTGTGQCVYGGTGNAGESGASVARVDVGSGNFAYAQVTGVTDTLVEITWSLVGTVPSTCFLYFQFFA